jgi:uncharacterized membrane protein YfcA
VTITVALGALVGIVLGLLGGGGSVLAVPLLLYVAGLAPRDAIAISLIVVGASSLSASVVHARAARIAWRVGLLFAVASTVGAYGGARAARFVPAGVLLGVFAVTMVASAIGMVCKSTRGIGAEQGPTSRERIVRTVLVGLGTGATTGAVGAGGGFMIVPALALVGGLPVTTAVGTSLFVIAMNSFAGVLGYAGQANIPWALAVPLTVASSLGSALGAWLAGRAKQETLRVLFGFLVLSVAALMLVREAPMNLDPVVILALFVALVRMGACAFGTKMIPTRLNGTVRRRSPCGPTSKDYARALVRFDEGASALSRPVTAGAEIWPPPGAKGPIRARRA